MLFASKGFCIVTVRAFNRHVVDPSRWASTKPKRVFLASIGIPCELERLTTLRADDVLEVYRARTNRGRINRLDALSLDGFRRLGVLRFVHKFFVPVSAVPALDVSNINPSASLHRATRGIQR